MSRGTPPTRLSPSTVIATAMPGASAVRGARPRSSRLAWIIGRQEARGGCVPSPANGAQANPMARIVFETSAPAPPEARCG